jgi:hypothetical protein
VLRERPRLSLDLLDRYGTDLLEAVVALDKAGVHHLDIKPANLASREVLLGADPPVWLTRRATDQLVAARQEESHLLWPDGTVIW